jgi:hypothetical protein
VRVTERHLDRIPPGNVRVPLGEFAALWSAAEEQSRVQGERGITDWTAGGVALTCRWMARAVTETSDGHRMPTPAPVTKATALASEELIESEFLAAETMAARTPPPPLVATRPGFMEAVVATLRWAWRSSGPVPDLTPVG